MLAEEAIAAVYSMRDANFSSLADGTHGLGTANNKWALSGSSDEHDVFTRTIAISTVDSYRKDVTITITWEKKPGVTSTITFVTQIGKWFSKSW